MQTSLYPKIEPYNHFYHNVTVPHRLYVEECGNPKGLPVIFIHGGPGAGCSKDDRRFFNPEKYRIILFDQRGCNRSTPIEIKRSWFFLDSRLLHSLFSVVKMYQYGAMPLNGR